MDPGYARLEGAGDRLLIRDTGSSNGTFVNGARVESAELDEMSAVQLGETTLALRLPSGRLTA